MAGYLDVLCATTRISKPRRREHLAAAALHESGRSYSSPTIPAPGAARHQARGSQRSRQRSARSADGSDLPCARQEAPRRGRSCAGCDRSRWRREVVVLHYHPDRVAVIEDSPIRPIQHTIVMIGGPELHGLTGTKLTAPLHRTKQSTNAGRRSDRSARYRRGLEWKGACRATPRDHRAAGVVLTTTASDRCALTTTASDRRRAQLATG